MILLCSGGPAEPSRDVKPRAFASAGGSAILGRRCPGAL